MELEDTHLFKTTNWSDMAFRDPRAAQAAQKLEAYRHELASRSLNGNNLTVGQSGNIARDIGNINTNPTAPSPSGNIRVQRANDIGDKYNNELAQRNINGQLNVQQSGQIYRDARANVPAYSNQPQVPQVTPPNTGSNVSGVFGRNPNIQSQQPQASNVSGVFGANPLGGQQPQNVQNQPQQNQPQQNQPQQGEILQNQPSVQNGNGIIDQAPSFYGDILNQAGQFAQEQQQLAYDSYASAENARKLQLQQQLSQTNAGDALKASGRSLGDLSVSELEQLAVSEGLTLSQELRDDITRRGENAIKSLQINRDSSLAEVEKVKNDTERKYERAIDNQTRVNTINDVRLRRSLAQYGGGNAENLIGTVMVNDAAQQGAQQLNDIVAEYADTKTMLGVESNKIRDVYTVQVNEINFEMLDRISQAKSKLDEKIDELIGKGVSNVQDLNKASLAARKEYIETYRDVTEKAYNAIVEQNKVAYQRALDIQKQAVEYDKFLTSNTGVVYSNGQPLVDQFGNAVPTIDGLKFQNQVDETLTTQTGYIHQNGRLLLDNKGNPIPTIAREQFGYNQYKDQVQFGFDQQRLNLSQASFAQQSAVDDRNFQLNLEKFVQDTQNSRADMILQGMKDGSIDPSRANAMLAQLGINLGSTALPNNNGKYGFSFSNDGSLQVNVASTKDVPANRRQCGAFVNDVLGLTAKRMGDSLQSKLALVNSEAPIAGGAFVMDVGTKYGHTGIVEAVGSDGIIVADMNRSGNEQFSRRFVAYDSAEYKKIKGFYSPSSDPVSRQGREQALRARFNKALIGDAFSQDDRKRYTEIFNNTLKSGDLNQAEENLRQIEVQKYSDLAKPIVQKYQRDTDIVTTLQNKAYQMRELFNQRNDTSRQSLDTTLVYLFNKMLDENSVVREGEFDRTILGQSLPNRIAGQIQKLRDGGVGLTDEDREGLVKTAELLVNSLDNMKNWAYNRASNTARGRGIPLEFLGSEIGISDGSSAQFTPAQQYGVSQYQQYNNAATGAELQRAGNQVVSGYQNGGIFGGIGALASGATRVANVLNQETSVTPQMINSVISQVQPGELLALDRNGKLKIITRSEAYEKDQQGNFIYQPLE